MNLKDFLGWIGAALILVAYFLVSFNLLNAQDWRFSWMNAIGAVLLCYISWIKSAFQPAIVNFIWALVALYALIHG